MYNVLWLLVIIQSFKIYFVVSSRCTIIQMKYSDVGSQCKVHKIDLFILQMIMTKVTGVQSPMMTKKYTKVEKGSLKDSREKLRTKVDRRTDRQTDGQTDRVIPVYPPSTSWRGV